MSINPLQKFVCALLNLFSNAGEILILNNTALLLFEELVDSVLMFVERKVVEVSINPPQKFFMCQ